MLKDRKNQGPPAGEVIGPVRLGSRGRDYFRRIQAGDVVVINHEDLDRATAEALVERKPAAVINTAQSITGRYPNLGPEILINAGIRLIDDAGTDALEVRDGRKVRITEEGSIYRKDSLIAEGTVLTSDAVAAAKAAAKAGMTGQLKAFATNTVEYVETEQDLLLNGIGKPELSTNLTGRHVLIAVRGERFKDELTSLKRYIRDYRPVLIGMDAGADALIEAGFKPDIIVGVDEASDDAVTSGAEVVVHEMPGTQAPGRKRVADLGVEHKVFSVTAAPEDAAMMLADTADLIVALGTHASLEEFLDTGRRAMASTFMTRIQLGGKVVDANSVRQLYRPHISNWQLAVLILAGITVLAVAFAVTLPGQAMLENLGVLWTRFTSWIGDWR